MATLVISGPSGVGKGTTIAALTKTAGMHLAVSATTRPARPGEVNGQDYLFLDEATFLERLSLGDFIEHNHYAGSYYGTPKSEIVDGCIIECDVNGVRQLRQSLADAVFVFLAPPSLDILEQRLRGRGSENEEQIQRRLQQAREELAVCHELYDNVIVADDVDSTVQKILALLN